MSSPTVDLDSRYLWQADGTNHCFLTLELTVLSTANTTYIVVPFDAEIVSVHTAVNTQLATAPEVLTIKTAAGTVGTISIANGGAVGDVDSLTPTAGAAANVVASGATIEIENSGASTSGDRCTVTIVLKPTNT